MTGWIDQPESLQKLVSRAVVLSRSVLAVVISCIVVVPLALLLFFALARMKQLKRLKIHAGVGKFTQSF